MKSTPPIFIHQLSKSRLTFAILAIVLILIIISAYFISQAVLTQMQRDRQDLINQTLEASSDLHNQQVGRMLLKRTNQGATEYVEILNTGKLSIYDGDMNLKQQGYLGIARVRSLFRDLEEGIGDCSDSNNPPPGDYFMLVTNQCTHYISSSGSSGQWEDIIDTIDKTTDQIFSPTPTPAPSATPTPTPIASPTPSGFTPSSTPAPSPTLDPSQPTPTPSYLTDPPFTCEEYAHLNHPVTISNIVCGAD